MHLHGDGGADAIGRGADGDLRRARDDLEVGEFTGGHHGSLLVDLELQVYA